jgi:hypothetical protein
MTSFFFNQLSAISGQLSAKLRKTIDWLNAER